MERRTSAADPVERRLGGLRARLAASEADVERALALRAAVFRGGETDRDRFDAACDHLVVEADGEVVATYRLLPQQGSGLSYVSTEFAVEALRERHPGLRFLELGRSCVAPGWRTRRVMEILWAATWAYVVECGIDVMLGCASLPGTVPDGRLLAFLHRAARAPEEWRVHAVPGRGIAMTPSPPDEAVSDRETLRRLPPLLKGYLRLGAWVGEEAVVDHDLETTDVFVVLHRARIRARYLDHFGTDASRHRA